MQSFEGGAGLGSRVAIRPETPADIPAIHAVNEAAFDGPAEAEAADALRSNGKVILSLVAVLESDIVGHVMFSPATITTNTGTAVQALLGPIGVRPDLQRRGIGSALVKAGLSECLRLGYGSVFLLGDPAYYGRFGFKPAKSFGVRFVRPLTNEDAFQAIELQPGALDDISGVARHEPELE
jgi:putative acetyltransferase